MSSDDDDLDRILEGPVSDESVVRSLDLVKWRHPNCLLIIGVSLSTNLINSLRNYIQ